MKDNQLKYQKLKNKLIGEILEEAGLVNSDQIAVALMEQSFYTHLKLGEILSLHGWVDQDIVDFFAEKIHSLPNNRIDRIGEYLFQAGLLTEDDVKTILQEQKSSGIKFGSLAVLRGCIKQKTLDFFLKYFTDNMEDTNHLHYDIPTLSNLSKESKFTSSTKNTVSDNNTQTSRQTKVSVRSQSKINQENKKGHHIHEEELIDDDLESLTWLKPSN